MTTKKLATYWTPTAFLMLLYFFIHSARSHFCSCSKRSSVGFASLQRSKGEYEHSESQQTLKFYSTFYNHFQERCTYFVLQSFYHVGQHHRHKRCSKEPRYLHQISSMRSLQKHHPTATQLCADHPRTGLPSLQL